MTRRERIFAALDSCQDTESPACEDCYYADPDIGTCQSLTALYEDIRAELESERPRLIEPLDFKGSRPDDGGAIPAWKESRKPTRRSGWAVITYGKWLADTSEPADGHCAARYWTSRPTDEQREATPWP